MMDCGALQKTTSSLINCKELKEKDNIIETADCNESMMKSTVNTYMLQSMYFVQNQMGEVVTITVPALFVKGQPQTDN
jgi:hypothetical protein